MSVGFQVILFFIGIVMLVNGSLMIYTSVRKSKFGEGQIFRRINKVLSDNAVMKEALKEIAEAEVLIGFHPQEDTEIYEYMDAITEMSRDIKRLMSKAHMALGRIEEEEE